MQPAPGSDPDLCGCDQRRARGEDRTDSSAKAGPWLPPPPTKSEEFAEPTEPDPSERNEREDRCLLADDVMAWRLRALAGQTTPHSSPEVSSTAPSIISRMSPIEVDL